MGEYAGAIDWRGANGTVNNCTFTNNKAFIGGTINWFCDKGSVNNCNFINNTASYGGAICFYEGNNSVNNCNFINNTAGDNGGAIGCTGANNTVNNCNFTNNNAGRNGGALYWDVANGTVNNCTFNNNTAEYGGALYWDVANGTVNNCTFNNNTAEYGGAIYWRGVNGTLNNCIFTNNKARDNGGGVIVKGDNCIVNNCAFINNTARDHGGSFYITGNNVIVSNNTIINDHVWDDVETIFLDRVNRTRLNNNIILSKNLIKLYNPEDWNLDYNWFGSTIENYTQNPISGLCENYLFLKNNQFYNYNLKDNSVNEYDNGLLPIMDLNIKKDKRSDTTINKLNTRLYAPIVATTYNIAKNLIISLKDYQGKSLNGKIISVNNKKYKTDKNGQVKIPIGTLVPGSYTRKISFTGDNNYKASTITTKFTIKRATPIIIAKARKFKSKIKIKKYSVTVKFNKNKPIKNKYVYLKINKKTYKVKTNNKGVAIFKISKLNKKGRFSTIITYNRDKYFNKVTKKVFLTMI